MQPSDRSLRRYFLLLTVALSDRNIDVYCFVCMYVHKLCVKQESRALGLTIN